MQELSSLGDRKIVFVSEVCKCVPTNGPAKVSRRPMPSQVMLHNSLPHTLRKFLFFFPFEAFG